MRVSAWPGRSVLWVIVCEEQSMAKPHEVLGVGPYADEATINAAFRKAAKKYHPDLNGGDAAGVRKLRRLIAARDFLIKHRQRPLRACQGRGWNLLFESLVRKKTVPITFALARSFVLAFLVAFNESGSAPVVITAEKVTVYTEDLDIPDIGSADIKAIRDWQETPEALERETAKKKKPEARHNLRQQPDSIKKTLKQATSLLKDWRSRVFSK